MRLFVILFVVFVHSAALASNSSVELSSQGTINTILTVITVIIAVLTFGITVLIPIVLVAYRRYNRVIKKIDIQIEMVHKIEDLMAQYEIDTFEPNSSAMTLPRFTLRKHIQSLTNPPAHDVIASQKLACTNLAQLVTNSKLIWPKKLKSLIRFMRANGLLSNELLRSHEYNYTLVKELKDIAEDDIYGESASRYVPSEAMFKDFVYGFLVLLSILIILAVIANGDGLMKWVIEMAQMIKDML